jgi:hypothetical protein
VERDDVLRQDRVIAHGRAAIIATRNVGGGYDPNDAWRRTDRVETQPRDTTMRKGRAADCDVERPFRLADIVDIYGGAADMAHGGVMGDRDAHDTSQQVHFDGPIKRWHRLSP